MGKESDVRHDPIKDKLAELNREDTKQHANSMRHDAHEVAHGSAKAAENLLSDVDSFKNGSMQVKDIARELERSHAATVTRDKSGEPTSITFKPEGKHGKPVEVNLGNSTVSGQNREHWEARGKEQDYGRALSLDAQLLSHGSSNGARGLLKDLSDLSTDGVSLKAVASDLERSKQAIVKRDKDGEVESINFKASDKEGKPVNVDITNLTVDNRSDIQWQAKIKNEEKASQIASEARAAADGAPRAAQQLLRDLSGGGNPDVVAELAASHKAVFHRGTEGAVQSIDLPGKPGAQPVSIDLEHKTVNGRNAAAWREDEATMAASAFKQRLDSHPELGLSDKTKELAVMVGSAILHGDRANTVNMLQNVLTDRNEALKLSQSMKFLDTSFDPKKPAQSPLEYRWDPLPIRYEHNKPIYGAHFELGNKESGRLWINHGPVKDMAQTFPDVHDRRNINQRANQHSVDRVFSALSRTELAKMPLDYSVKKVADR